MKFNELNLPNYMISALENFGITTPTEIQEKSIPSLLLKKDLVGISETGSGKTFAFGLPAIEIVNSNSKGVEALVICPTRELAAQSNDEIKRIAEFKQNCQVVPIFGGANMDRQRVALKNAKIVVGTPGRIMDHLRRKTLKLENLKYLVLDEADEMLKMGFKEDIETILQSTPKTRQTVMFSATMPKPILDITRNYMNNPLRVTASNQHKSQEFIEQLYLQVNRNEKDLALVGLIKHYNPNIALVFSNTKAKVDELKIFLKKFGIASSAIHGDMRQSERKRTMDAFKKKGQGILIATDVMARGIDIQDVNMIINYDIPREKDFYVHRIGRTARAGKKGLAITIINTMNQLVLLKELEKETHNTITKLNLDLKTIDFETDLNINSYFDNNKQEQKNKSNNENKTHRKQSNGRYNKNSNATSKTGNFKNRTFKNKENKADNNFDEAPRKTFNKNKTANNKRFSNSNNSLTKVRGFGKNQHKENETFFEENKSSNKNALKKFSKDNATSSKSFKQEKSNFKGITENTNRKNAFASFHQNKNYKKSKKS